MLLIWAAGLRVFDQILQRRPKSGLHQAVSSFNLTGGEVAFLAAASVPLGWMVYQMYHFSYGRVYPFGIVPLDRGRIILGQLTDDAKVSLALITERTPDLKDYTRSIRVPGLHLWQIDKKSDVANYRVAFRRNWELVQTAMLLLAIRDKDSSLRDEYTTLSDIYQAHGATRIAIVLGTGLAVVSVVVTPVPESGWSYPLNVLALALGLVVLRQVRGNVLLRMDGVLGQSLRALTHHRGWTAEAVSPARPSE